jgi:uncharacterized protein (DUF433 family)
VKKWSFTDLLVLRLVDWLRRDKPDDNPDLKIPGASMGTIRRELAAVTQLGERLSGDATIVFVDRMGRLHFGGQGRVWVELGAGVSQELIGTEVDLMRPSLWREGLRGPDLQEPRPTLRIVPGKLAGAPHVARTRIPTEMIAALDRRGFEQPAILELYPSLRERAVLDAIDLEDQLEANLRHGAVA